MEVSLVDPREAEQEREQREREREEKEKNPPEQVVDLDYLARQRQPDDAKYVSEFDSDPDKEYRAPKNRRGQAGHGDRLDATDEPKPSSPRPRQQAGMALPLGGREAIAGDEDDSRPGESTEPGDDRPESDTTTPQTLSPRGARGLPDSLRKEWGSPGTHDALEDDMEVAPGNMLKTKRWEFASFFNRVRNGVAQHWHPEVVHAANDPDGRKHGTKTRRTRLLISLNPDGSLHKVRLDSSSNVDYLDEEAIRAVRQAAPFVNPPPGLVDEGSGLIEFGFAFIFEIHGGRRIFRYRN
jgi:TonB family protein